ncbi:MAG: hypothetical protein ACNS63_10860 [Candidatus Nitrospinota bacterium M3_3B_026]
MANLTEDRKTARKDGTLFAHPVAAAAVIYAGALVCLDSSGRAVPAADDASFAFAGKADERADNSTGAAGDVLVLGRREGVFEYNASGMTQADTGADVYVVDDNTVGHGIAAQPVNVTGVTLERVPMSMGGSRQLAYTAASTSLSFGGGAAVDVSAGGSFVLTAADGSMILAKVTAASLPGTDQSDTIQLRHVRAGRIAEAVSASSVYVDILGAARG